MIEHRDGCARSAVGPVFGSEVVDQRVIAYSLGVIACYVTLIVGVMSRGIWFVDSAGHGIPTDFIAFWGAGRLALDGAAPLAYDIDQLKMVQALGLGQNYSGVFPWFYPPFFLLIVAPLALLPYVPALFLWIGATLAMYLAAVRAILPRTAAVAVALAVPALYWNVVTGQNGFLTAALLGTGLVLLDRRPWVAGMLLGLLAYKPHFAAAIPLVLLAAGHWRALTAAAVTFGTLVGVSTALFGWGIWPKFLAAQSFAAELLLGGGIGLFKIQSVYAALRVIGLSNELAWVGHGFVAVTALIAVLWVWRQPVSASLKAAALATGILVITPYLLNYDLVLLTVPVAFLARKGLDRGFLSGERLSLLAVLLIPLLFAILPSPAGIAAYAILAFLVGRRVCRSLARNSPSPAGSRQIAVNPK